MLAAHLGRPKGVDPAFSLRPVAERLAELTGWDVRLAPAVVGDEVEALAAALEPGAVLMLENVRFEPGETKNDPELAAAYGRLAEAYVDDAFGVAHRAHASNVGVVEHVAVSAAGELLRSEVRDDPGNPRDPPRPLVAIVGGAKVTDKIGVLDAFLDRADAVLIGGAMCFPFLRSQGHAVGDSLCADEDLEPARARARRRGAARQGPAAAGRPRARRRASPPTPSGASSTASTSPTAGWGSTSARARAALYAERDRRRRAASSGTGRWARSSSSRSAPARAPSPRPSRLRRHDRRRRRRQRGGAGAVRARGPRQPPVDGRRGDARAGRGQDAAGSGGSELMSRTPFVAGNWKMHKTVAEAEMFISGLLPLLYSSEGVDVGDLRAVHGARARSSTRRAARASRSSPRTCTPRPRAPSPARSRRRC